MSAFVRGLGDYNYLIFRSGGGLGGDLGTLRGVVDDSVRESLARRFVSAGMAWHGMGPFLFRLASGLGNC